MALLHSFFAESDSQRHSSLEVVNTFLDLVSDVQHVVLLAVTELPKDLIDSLLTVFPNHLEVGGIELIPVLGHPLFVAVKPGSGRLPHVGVGCKVFCKAKQLLVVCGVGTNQSFVAVKLASLIDAVLNLLVNFINRCSNVSILVKVLVLLKLKDGLFQVSDVLKELFLLKLHIFDHCLLELLEDESLGFHDANDALGAAK